MGLNVDGNTGKVRAAAVTTVTVKCGAWIWPVKELDVLDLQSGKVKCTDGVEEETLDQSRRCRSIGHSHLTYRLKIPQAKNQALPYIKKQGAKCKRARL